MGFVDGTDEIHYVNGVFDDKDGCAGDLTQNNYPFKLGARARGTGMATSSDADASAVTDNGSRFYGEIDEAMVFNRGLTDPEAKGERRTSLPPTCGSAVLTAPLVRDSGLQPVLDAGHNASASTRRTKAQAKCPVKESVVLQLPLLHQKPLSVWQRQR